ncbi:MAG: fibronectin type III domain-containing protein [Bacteroidota bacterium]|nr:fibronectin type III domain-containing protein [Bacteroidota bacterium]
MDPYFYTLHVPRRGWQLLFFRRPWLLVMLALLTLASLAPRRSQAQVVATYTFAASTTTFTPLTGATPTPVLLADEGVTAALPLPFTFRFDGVDYTSVYATSNGCLSFNPSAGGDYQNSLATTHPNNDPLIAALWDDLGGGQDPSSFASYVLTGSAPNRVFTFEWLNWSWNYVAPTGSVSFQIKLHEGSNQVEMVYRPEAGAVLNPSASVGLRSVGGSGAGSFLSVSDLTTGATASNTTSNDNITAKPTAGLDFTFSPTACTAPTYAALPLSQSFETAWTDACATHNAAGISWRTTPLTGETSWRRDDDGASANWSNPGGYLPVPVASQGSHAAVFHSSYGAPGATGGLDLYANLSGAGIKVLTFDYNNYLNGTRINDDYLDVLLSTDGGATFNPTPLLTVGSTGSAGYTAQSVVIPSTSATTVIRFRGTADFGYSDIGLDNVALMVTSCPPPTALAASSISSTSASITFTPVSGATSYVVTYTRQGNAAQTVSTATSPVALSGLTPASIYTVTVMTDCGGGNTSATTSPISFTTAPTNDLCASASTLTPAATCTATAGTVGGATTSSTDNKLDVWYKFTASGYEYHVVVTPATGATISPVTEVYAGGSCPASGATPLSYNSSSSDTHLTGLIPLTVYYVRVYDFYNNPLTPTAGAFNICLTQPPTPTPANDLCGNSQAITPATPCAGTTGTVGGATSDITLDDNDDVWYSFVAGSTQHNILVTPTAGASLVTEVYGSACPTSSTTPLIHNASSNNTLVTGLTAGQTYFVRVYNFYSASGFLTPAAGAFTICIDAPAPANNLVVSTTMNIPAGTYDNVTVTSTGVATLTGTLTVNQSLTVMDNGVFNDNSQLVTGAGSFTVSSGGTLAVCNAAGIDGAIQTTGSKSYSTDATYNFVGTQGNQVTSAGLPTQVRNLGISNVNGTVLTAHGVAVAQTLTVSGTGNFNASGQTLTLLSSSAGTALVVNSSTGVVSGTVQVQRYVSNSLNTGLGYRHLSSPVAGAPVSQIGSGGSPIVTNPLFNAASATVRPTIVPYPTVFSYDETQVPAGGSTTQAFDQGYQSPASSSAVMGTAQGYTAQVGGGQTLTFSGSPNNGSASVTGLGYGSAGTQAGWHLLGNPYPAPLDWSTLSVGTTATDNLQNLSGAVYVFQSSGQYAGTYRTYQNGQGGDPIIASGQAFFVRTAGVGQSGTFRTSNANRVTTWSATNSTLYRGGNDPRPRLTLALASPGSPADATTMYTEAGATSAVDARYDAYKLRNPGAANLYSLAGADELTINGLAPLATADVVVPLGFSLLAAGPCVIHLDDLANFATTTGVLLRDNFLGTLTDLRQQPSYAFTATAGGLASTTRFALVLRPSGALATHGGLQASQVTLYPNPAHQSATLLLPAVADAHTATAVLLDALGRTLWQRTLPVGPTGSSTVLDLRTLSTGVYLLRLQAGTGAPVTKRLTVE